MYHLKAMAVEFSVGTMYDAVYNLIWLPLQLFKSCTLIRWGLIVTTTRRNIDLLVLLWQAITLWSHVWFPWSHEGAFGGLIGRLYYWNIILIWLHNRYQRSKLCQIHFCDYDVIDDVIVRLWKFSDFGSRKYVGIAAFSSKLPIFSNFAAHQIHVMLHVIK